MKRRNKKNIQCEGKNGANEIVTELSDYRLNFFEGYNLGGPHVKRKHNAVESLQSVRLKRCGKIKRETKTARATKKNRNKREDGKNEVVTAFTQDLWPRE